MTKSFSVHCCIGCTQFKGKEEGGIFDYIDDDLINHPIRNVQNGNFYSGDLYILDTKKNHKQIFECIQKNNIKHEFTFEEAFFLLNKTAQMFSERFSEEEKKNEEWRFIIYLYSTNRYISVNSRKISEGGTPEIKKRIVFCEETKPFYEYPAGTGILLRF